ncbi:MAG TPA: lysophospholipid acyltransferase family protein, partial [Solirubrobacteraceae bacterium]
GPGYRLMRWILVPLLRLYFRVRITGAENIPKTGAAVIVPNHKSFLDSFFLALATKRHLRFMGKSELFEGIWGRPFVALGAFPVRRGESDQDALDTARAILEQGELLALFPEGTRVREPATLGEPKRGAARLALEAGAPLVPAAITGSDHIWLGPFPKPKRVQVAFAPPVSVAHLEPTPEAARELIDDAVWPQVEGEFRTLLNRPTVIAAGLALLGIGAGAAVRRKRKRR